MRSERLRTPICDLLGIEIPILQAGMGGVAYSELAVAVANAGGLGTLAGIDMSVDRLDQEIRHFRELSTKPLCVDLGFPRSAPDRSSDVVAVEVPQPIRLLYQEIENLGIEMMEVDEQAISRKDNDAKLDLVIDHGVEVLACALGTPPDVVQRCHDHGIVVMAIAGRAKHAARAIENGADIVIVQGSEGGGHTGDVGLLTLLSEVLEFSTVPVVAAGGIATGRQIAAVLVGGAQGVWIGTRFLATEESLAEPNFKAAVVAAEHDSTIRSTLFDGLFVRQLRNRFTDAWEGHESEMKPFPVQRMLTAPIRYTAAAHDLRDYMSMPAGQSSGLVHDIVGAGDLLVRLADEAVDTLEKWCQRMATNNW